MAKILVIGVATLDVIQYVDGYPIEDSEVRAAAMRVARGGNAANIAVVLAQCGHTVSFAGTLADDADAERIRVDLHAYGVAVDACPRLPAAATPTSCIIVNRQTSSRTIVHYRDLPEFSVMDFDAIDLADFDWLHFEGRNARETGLMLTRARTQRPDLPISVEIEKPRPNIAKLFSLADTLLFARSYALQQGYADARALFDTMQAAAPQADMFCTWGEEGAALRTRAGEFFTSAAQAPGPVIDTLGAGDTFHAAVIHASLIGLPPAEILSHACALAGRKCTVMGFAGLTE